MATIAVHFMRKDKSEQGGDNTSFPPLWGIISGELIDCPDYIPPPSPRVNQGDGISDHLAVSPHIVHSLHSIHPNHSGSKYYHLSTH
jgi:hypothetical protein